MACNVVDDDSNYGREYALYDGAARIGGYDHSDDYDGGYSKSDDSHGYGNFISVQISDSIAEIAKCWSLQKVTTSTVTNQSSLSPLSVLPASWEVTIHFQTGQ